MAGPTAVCAMNYAAKITTTERVQPYCTIFLFFYFVTFYFIFLLAEWVFSEAKSHDHENVRAQIKVSKGGPQHTSETN